jgi:eukaryotic translation initiation factor 2C
MAPKGKKQQAGAGAVATCTDLELPSKPARKGRAPGHPVELISNLFRISIMSHKSILCYTIVIDLVTDSPESTQGGDKKPAAPRKIPKDLRREAAIKSVQNWIKNNRVPPAEAKFVLDSNASTMYALFKMLDVHDGSPGTRKHSEIRATVSSAKIVDQKAVQKDESMLVKFYSPSPVNVRELIDYCAGKLHRRNADIEAVLKALNTILTGRILTIPGYLGMQAKTGSCSVFPLDRQNQFEISEGVFCNKGFISSVRPTETGVVANIANSVLPFYEPIELLDFLKIRYSVNDFSKELPAKIIEELKRELRTKQIEAIHINYGQKDRPHYRKYRVHDIGMSTTKEKFELDVGGKKSMITVFDYFKKEYPKYPLKYPNLPCIIDNKRMIPLEVCRLVDKQKVNRRLTPTETSKVIKQAAMRPEKHFEKVQENANLLGRHDQTLKDFGLNIEMKPIELTGRELPPISLLAGGQQPLKSSNGGYDSSRAKFVKTAKIDKWALIVLGDDRFRKNFQSEQQFQADCSKFASTYCRAGRDKGIQIADLKERTRYIPVLMGEQDQPVKKKLRDEYERLNKENYDHAVFILPGIKDWIYSYLQYLEVDVPQKIGKKDKCTRASRIKDANFIKKILRGDHRSIMMFVSNLWLKYNTKMGGVNHVLDARQNFSIQADEFNNFLLPGYLFVSIDVCHPAPGDRLEQSVAAAVGLWNITNPNMSSCTRVRVQRKDKSDKEKSTVEQVGEIGIMFEEILQSYYKRSNKLPTHIVVLRDGVSEGQFQMVLQFELSQIKARIKNYYDKLKVKSPLLACLTVQKRHRTRFRRKQPDMRKGTDYNIQPGTVVDNTVVEPLHHSFYLAPHKAIQGTARAPHVHMIYDEIKFSQDSAQAMIFSLSYLSPRCTKGTSIPTPVNLADLAAERGKNIVVSWNEDNPQRMSSEERLVKLNAFLTSMGDSTYQDTLYYV